MKKEPIIPLKERLISFETAILAKEKGFKNACDGFVNKDNEYIFMPDLLYPNNSEFSYNPEEDPEVIEWEEMMKTLALAPTQSLLQKWLREVHEISIKIDDYYTNSRVRFDYNVCELGSQEDNPVGIFETYEEALDAGLYQALKLIKNS